MAQLHDLTALDAAAAVRRREVSPTELVEHALDRIARLDVQVGAFVTVTAESARAEAAAAEARVLAADDPAALPPLLGVPTAIKDLNMVAGVPTKLGSTVFAGFVPDYDDNVVRLLREAGTISVGKTSTPEIGLPCYTETDIGPPARTPWDTSRLAGGSSGGAAAAVASGFLPFAQGSDGGGSIRIPASVCGLVGLKTSRGRVSRGPLDLDSTRLSVLGPLARTVRDAAAFLDAVAIPQPGDPERLPAPADGFLAQCERDPGRLRIGRYLDPPMDAEVDPEVRAAWSAAAELLAGLGHELEDSAPPIPPEAIPHFETIWAVSAACAPVDPAREPGLRPLTRHLRERGRAVSGVQFADALAMLNVFSRRGIAASAHLNAVLTPTVALLPRPIGWFQEPDGDPAEDFERQKRFTPYTAIYNTTGQPAISLPLYQSREGLPIGVMLVGRPGGEAALLTLAAQLEAACPWRDRVPPIWHE
ncbi:MAG TPA: amidase [Jatrophihabitans sp.]|jgi:amidase|uniref:amidase n=1 Tax=Jatrophihabitans sp. TaxID=1932789 RepID=UPI002E03D05F|nr:amidase [Jatrophihabitans sp.]